VTYQPDNCLVGVGFHQETDSAQRRAWPGQQNRASSDQLAVERSSDKSRTDDRTLGGPVGRAAHCRDGPSVSADSTDAESALVMAWDPTPQAGLAPVGVVARLVTAALGVPAEDRLATTDLPATRERPFLVTTADPASLLQGTGIAATSGNIRRRCGGHIARRDRARRVRRGTGAQRGLSGRVRGRIGRRTAGARRQRPLGRSGLPARSRDTTIRWN
jgi:hypothetical protein